MELSWGADECRGPYRHIDVEVRTGKAVTICPHTGEKHLKSFHNVFFVFFYWLVVTLGLFFLSGECHISRDMLSHASSVSSEEK